MDEKYLNWVFYTYRRNQYLSAFTLKLKPYLLLFKKIANDFFNIIYKKDNIKIEPKDIWIIANTSNNYNSTLFLRDYLNNTKILQIKRRNNHIENLNIGFYWSTIFDLVRFMFFNKDKWYRFNPELLYDSVNFHNKVKKLFLKVKPKAIIFSNDHYHLNRILLKEAKKNGIPTIYIAHASVSDIFPPLEFDHSFLFGRAMQEKYFNIGNINGKTHLLGNPRSDELISIRILSRDPNIIGIGLNLLDDFEMVKLTIEKLLKENKSLIINIRFHPRSQIKRILIDNRVNYISANDQSLSSYLAGISTLISGNSSLILDAAIAGVKPVHFYHEKEPIIDYYGFIEKGVAKLCVSHNDLVNELKNTSSLEYLKNSKHFEESIDSAYQGNVKKKIGEKIYKIIYE